MSVNDVVSAVGINEEPILKGEASAMTTAALVKVEDKIEDTIELLKSDKQGLLDAVLEKVASRKLIVFSISTWLLLSKALTPDHWVMLALVYLGVQGALDIVVAIKKASK